MDFFVRLITNKPSKPSDGPRQRLSRFQKLWDRLLHTVEISDLQNNKAALEFIRTTIQSLTNILHDESRSPAPHLAIQFASSNQLYTTISKIGISAYDEPIIRETVTFFGALIDSEEEDFLENERFAQCLMNYVDKISGTGDIFVGEDTEVEIVETLFGIAAKIRLQPEVLPVWFQQRNTQSVLLDKRKEKEKHGFAGITQKEDFPLCYQLIDHVHHGGRIGDFARTGLLYIFESAPKSEDLEQWLVDSDIPTLMATGLGALYSQMSRKLSIVHPKDDRPVVLLLSDYPNAQPAADAEDIFSDDFTTHMATFLSYLQFWQDVLEHCNSHEVRESLLDHFRVLFLQQLLYPSLLESSDTDGGSSVAVLTYLGRILDALDNAQMKHLLLQYLLAAPSTATGAEETPSSPRALRRQKSLILLAAPAEADNQMDPSLFSLVDLLTSSLRSTNQETTVAALRLISTILGRNHAYAIGSLVKVQPVHAGEPHRTHGALIAELDAYMDLAKSLGTDGLDEIYEQITKDSLKNLESHPCSAQLLRFDELGVAQKRGQPAGTQQPSEPPKHRLDVNLGIFQYLAELVETFLTNNTEVNLSLTEAIVSIASCGQSQLEGWLSVEPSRYVYSDKTADLESSVVSLPAPSETPDPEEPRPADSAIARARRRPKWHRRDNPRLLAALHKVHAELDSLRSSVSNLDTLISGRRQAMQLHDEISDAIANAPPPLALKAGAVPMSLPATPRNARDKRSRPDRELSEYNASLSSAGPKFSTPAQIRTSGLASRDRSKSPLKQITTPRGAQSRSPPATPRGKGLSSMASTNSPGSWTPRSPQRALSPRPNAGGLDPSQLLNDVVREANGEDLAQKFTFPLKESAGVPENGEQGETKDKSDGPVGTRQASLSHILTNAAILRDFELELVALLQLRASMFDEVKFA